MAPKDKEAVEIAAESDKAAEDAAKKKGNNKKKGGKKSDNDNDALIADDNMSEEDKELKERLETCVSTVANQNDEEAVTVPIRLKALDVIVTELRTATASMTSVPKPLKFLRPHFAVLKELYNTTLQKESASSLGGDESDFLELRARLADVLSVLAMTMGKPEDRESLKFKLSGGKDYEKLSELRAKKKKKKKDDEKDEEEDDNLGSWGHEYVRSLAGEIGQEYGIRVVDGADPEQDEPFEDLLRMVNVIVPFHVTHNAEAEAVDLLIEVQRLKSLLTLAAIDENNYQRICMYLIKTADYMSDPDDLAVRIENCYYRGARKLRRMNDFFYDANLSCGCCCFIRKCWTPPTRFSKCSINTTMPCGSRCGCTRPTSSASS